MSSKRKRKDKEKEKEKRIKQAAVLYLETRAQSEGSTTKAFKACALNQLVGSHRLSARYMGGWVEFSE